VSDIAIASVVTELSIQSLMMSWLSSLSTSRTARMSIDRPPNMSAQRTRSPRLRSVRSLRSLCSPLTRYPLDGSRGTWPLVTAILGLSLAAISLGQEQRAARQQPNSVEQAIKELDKERIQAQIGADPVALDRIYADDFIGVGPSGTVRTKTQVISDFTSGSLKFQSITTDEVQVRVYGNTAVETGLSTMIGQDNGKAVPRDTRFTRVWIKQQRGWRLVANHYSLRVVPQ